MSPNESNLMDVDAIESFHISSVILYKSSITTTSQLGNSSSTLTTLSTYILPILYLPFPNIIASDT